ncbi:methyl-accepting chemotaxis protein [Vibrio mangrovi]|uniref:Methyl-accepting chemotaxis protein n=1 Tax=Vibrio mangrovi TaxID=474394 RepID=A0A1Y6IZ45_9VIBR|nr:methyl-accepting chemotaxis protein [Vibrio mangrovi]MDW6005282.1 methyl-accepting chemotaxis protein [Vibrio mangrovi]SMS02908.1 Methyl-accepting chemotaxis protein CtpH [Vibrio mangrovi]
MKHVSLLVRFSVTGFISIILICFLFLWGTIRLAQQLSDDFISGEMVGLEQQFNAQIDSMLAQSKLAVDTIAALPEVQQAVALHDKNALSRLFDAQWPDIRAAGVRQFQFHLPPAYSLYRVHKPEKSGDDLSSFRHTVVDVNTLHQSVAGIEEGVAGIGLRYVRPVSFEGQHVGSVEFGMSLNRDTFADLLSDKLLDLTIRVHHSGELKTVIQPQSGDVFSLKQEQYQQVLSGNTLNINMSLHEHSMVVRAFPLKDYSGRIIGIVEISHDISPLQAVIWSDVKMLMLYGLLSALVVALGLVWMTRHSIKPVQQIITAIDQMVEGQQGLGARLEQSGPQEINQLTQGFNRFCDKLQSTFEQMSDSVNHMAMQSEHLSKESVMSDKGMKDQKEEIIHISTAMTEMTATVHEVAQSIVQAAEAASHANDKAQSGREVLQLAIEQMLHLAESIQQTGTLSMQVHEATTAIASILEVIQGISEQTNLLALNAAIEAARAGDQGRGFAVVANEVRDLAQKTQGSTEEIRQKIAMLKNSVNETVTVIKSSQEQAQKSVDDIQSTGEVIRDMEQSVSQIHDMNTHIATASEQQAHVSDEINANVSNIHELSEVTAESSLRTAKLAAQIARDIEILSSECATFAGDSDLQKLKQAKTSHLAWKTKIRSYLAGLTQMSQQEAVSHKECRFGCWYESAGRQKFSHIPASSAIDQPHMELHRTIQEIIHAKENGNLQQAENLYKDIEKHSARVVSLLDEIIHHVESQESSRHHLSG